MTRTGYIIHVIVELGETNSYSASAQVVHGRGSIGTGTSADSPDEAVAKAIKNLADLFDKTPSLFEKCGIPVEKWDDLRRHGRAI